MAMATRPVSLEAHALRLLSQREHSRSELRRKLLPRAVAALAAETHAAAHADAGAGIGAGAAPAVHTDGDADGGGVTPVDVLQAATAKVEQVLDWLQARDYLSEARFVASRMRVRAPRLGALRIRAELGRHGLTLDADQAQELRDTELARAHTVWARKFKAPAGDAAERARQARFLAGRGFQGDVIRRIVAGLEDE
jgi:regulatory protein